MNEELQGWDKERWITQKREDFNLKPSRCPYCGGKLEDNNQGWYCEDCLKYINAVSYYMGANGKAKQLKKW